MGNADPTYLHHRNGVDGVARGVFDVARATRGRGLRENGVARLSVGMAIDWSVDDARMRLGGRFVRIPYVALQRLPGRAWIGFGINSALRCCFDRTHRSPFLFTAKVEPSLLRPNEGTPSLAKTVGVASSFFCFGVPVRFRFHTRGMAADRVRGI